MLPQQGDGLRYVVKKRGQPHAAFQFAADAERYIKSDAAADCLGKPLYGPADFTIEDARNDGRKVIGTNSHGHAILAALDRADAAAKTGNEAS